jgi:hypothetical protein
VPFAFGDKDWLGYDARYMVLKLNKPVSLAYWFNNTVLVISVPGKFSTVKLCAKYPDKNLVS